ncbi:MAG: prolyl oligopeptidase family serine peptidase [Gemmatimonadales bacterium]|nr:prolyl oligopeptidase family serine peptidase [Gemmatimonadales bacterium]NIN13292.1 prolyl oligopeptidase family serine peptidase [Gemmatimonadales bacterium]NIN51295.1 prolyl oligopeptidase family serine peptidase [Gemmatimonadales bacterium]NIP08759.1 prolyl oligopeptidase family serine peptidase [Gemmatimonadales bacterium]NIQ99753.1 prolyl oligopeptidase family serine peptidase [Gemmatimonadales bacterium]
MARKLLSALLVVPLLAILGARELEAQEFELSIENIMRGSDLVGTAPRGLRGGGFFRGGSRFSWTPDSRYVYFRWQQPGVDTALTVYRIQPRGGEPERLEDVDPDTILVGTGEWSRDRRRALFVVDGDLLLWERGRKRYLTRTRERESGPLWSADEKSVYFQRGGNLFALSLETSLLRQFTDIRRGDPPREEREPKGQRKFLVDQQEELFEFIRSGDFKSHPWNRAATRDTTEPLPFYPGEGKSVGGLRITPDGAFVLMNVREQARNTRRIEMPVWITPDGYLDTYRGRTKVGDAQGKSRAAILEVATGKVTFVGDSIGEGDRDIIGFDVSPNSKHALIRLDTKDAERRWYAVVDLPSLDTRVIDDAHDSAWLAGPLSYSAGFMPDGETVYLGSEKTGWAHLYLVPASGGDPTPLTSGEWEVLNAELSPDGETWRMTANKDGFAEVHFYTMPARGGTMTKVTTATGRQDVSVSPDGRWLAVSHSEANHPPELYVQENRAGRPMRKVTESTTEEWRRGPWIKPEIVMITARDGVQVPARLYRPQGDVAPAGQRPAVIFVHGAGYLQNVHNWWSSYYREYMFHHFLAANGYTVLDIDYRGSAGHGRDWRTAIYRHMGGKDLTDQVDGARWLVRNMGVDSARIGLYGGSYGGFITLMAMFTTPGVFKAGAALRPVTDWAHYNHGYTSNILNEPQNDSLAYRQSSPIYFAEGLEGHLLICHGMVDDNVLFYDTVRLVQRLIELEKENWEVAVYPAERHSFQQATSWTDEYRRIFKLFERTLK